jgi:hypothetical protein
MDHESLHEDYSDSEINDQSMSISEGNKSIEINQNENTFEDILGNSDPNENTFEDILENSDSNENTFEDILKESESEVNASYLNEAYADLMTLVTKYKLSNTTGNAIIKFFNKHANLSASPLPKSIEKGRKYMDNLNLPNLAYNKTLVTNYNNNYYLHHHSLINCIKNILSIHDILENFVLNFEKLEVIILVFYVYLY